MSGTRMNDTVFYHSGPIVTGRVVRLMPGYAREMKVGQPILMAILTAATVGRLIGRMILSALQAGARCYFTCGAVTLQMVVDLILIGLVARAFVNSVRTGLARRDGPTPS